MTSHFIHEAITGEGVVLVHCDLGVSRSVVVVAAYLIQHCGYTLDSAFVHLRSKRAFVRPNASFQRQLKAFCDTEYDVEKAHALLASADR